MVPQQVLIVGEVLGLRSSLREVFERRGAQVFEAGRIADAVAACRARAPDVVILDDTDEALARRRWLSELWLREHGLQTIVTSRASSPTSEAALGSGPDPANADRVAGEPPRPVPSSEPTRLLRYTASQDPIDPFIGTSPLIKRLARDAARLVSSFRPILLSGETGTGKGEVARWIHRNSPRSHAPFVSQHCAGITGDDLESILSAVRQLPSSQETADPLSRGTLFLDEIADLDLQLQARLLLAIEREWDRIRSGDLRLPVRLIVSSHQDLAKLVDHQRFRADLYFRLCALPLALPALRQRREDIPALAEALVRRLAAETGMPVPSLSSSARALLVGRTWRGNIRELRDSLARALLVCNGALLEGQDFEFPEFGESPASEPESAPRTPVLTLEELERAHIARVLTEVKGQASEAARRLGIARSSLYNKLKRYGMTAKSGPDSEQGRPGATSSSC